MSRGDTFGKRDREARLIKKRREKEERRAQKRLEGATEVPLTTAEEMTGPLPSVEAAMRRMNDRSSAPRGAASIPCKLFVASLSFDTDDDSLRAAFEEHGPVIEAVVIKDRDTGRSRGFGFVTIQNARDSGKIIAAMDRTVLDGREISVNIATER